VKSTSRASSPYPVHLRNDGGFLGFHRKSIEAVLPYLADGGLLGTFIDWRSLSIVHAAATALALTPLDLVV